jgi:hypothetical protein
MPDYKQGKNYKIINDQTDDEYIGSTTQLLESRMACHVSNAKDSTSPLHTLMREIGTDHFEIVLIEKYPCNNVDELRAREQYWITTLKPTLNKLGASKQVNDDSDSPIKIKRDYQQGKIYGIVNDLTEDEYAGSTYESLDKRMSGHKSKYLKHPNRPLYKLMNEIGFDHFTIFLIEDYPCDTVEELREREQYWITKMKPTLNAYDAVVDKTIMMTCECGSECTRLNRLQHFRTQKHQEYLLSIGEIQEITFHEIPEKYKEYRRNHYLENKEEIQKKRKKYNEEHKDEAIERSRKYYEVHKEEFREKVTCECGVVCSRGQLYEHRKSKTHKKYLETGEKYVKPEKKTDEELQQAARDRAKEWREQNRNYCNEKIPCECGSVCSRRSLAEHCKTKKHMDYVEIMGREEPDIKLMED